MGRVSDRLLSLNIGAKLTFTFITLIAITSIPLSFIVVSFSKKIFYENIIGSIKENLISEEFQIRYYVINRDYWSLFKFVKGLSEKKPVREAAVIDNNGRVLAHSDPQKYPIGSAYEKRGDISYPIEGFNTNIGSIIVVLDTDKIQEEFKPIQLFLIWSAVPFTGVSLLLGFFISYRIRSRLLRIRNSIERIKKGDLKNIRKVEFKEKDELQEFSDFLFETISKLRDYHENVEYAQRFYMNLLDTINEIVLVTDEEGRIFYANRRIETLGYMVNELIGVDINNIIEDQNKPKLSGYKEVLIKGKKGKIPALMGISGIDEWKIITLVDISERKSMEERLRKMEVLSTLGEMSANFAHELKNAMLPLKLLTSVDQFSEEDVQVIKKSIMRMDRLISTFLSFARPSPAEYVRIKLLSIIDDILFFLEPKIKEKEIRLVKEIEDIEIISSKDMLEIILINLLSNAIDAIEKRGEVGIRIYFEDEILNIEVWDSGKGIPENELNRIFDPFYTTKESGSGLGLPIVLRNVYLLEGNVEVKSEENKGTLFKVYIPVQGATGETSTEEYSPNRG